MNRFARYLSIFLVALLGGAAGALGVWFFVGRAEPQRTVRAEFADVSPTASPTVTARPGKRHTPAFRHAAGSRRRPRRPDPTSTPLPTPTSLPSLADLYADINPSIVTVINARAVPGMNNSTSEELVWGSGVIIDSRGYVLTNEHVAGAAQELLVTLHDGRTAPARYIAGDGLADLALIKIERDLRFQRCAVGRFPTGCRWRPRLGDREPAGQPA